MVSPDVEEVRSRLELGGYRLTPQRQAIFEMFLRHPEEHLSADDVYSLLRTSHPEIGLATVYRTLDLFREQKIINELDFGQGMSRYEYSALTHHHHRICLTCGQVWEFSSEALERVEKQLAWEHDFEVVGHHLKLYGYCSECRNKS